MPQFDVVVIGLGATGSAALYHLARRGVRACGIERFAPGHDRGSSHGETRMIRLGYFEHPSYVPLLRRTYALWRELEAASGKSLLHVTGIVEIGRPEGELVTGTLAASHAEVVVENFSGLGWQGLPFIDIIPSGTQNFRRQAKRAIPMQVELLQRAKTPQ